MSWAIWITGLPGSGKSVLSRAAIAALESHRRDVTLLELDAVRRVLTPSPTYGDGERETVYRSLVYMAAELTTAGIPVIIDATAHRRAWRDLAREHIARFAEVQVVCPVHLCQARERARTGGNAPSGIYAHAGRPGATVPGIDVAYEPARAPELTIDTATEATTSSVPRLVEVADRLSAGCQVIHHAEHGWVVWLTGLPGSGKTTIASAVANRLRPAGIPVRVLDLSHMRHLMGTTGALSPVEADIMHRALVYTAKLLVDAGQAVLIDATAPRRQWTMIGRELIGYFAEVFLSCPRHLCFHRERAARWTPWSEPPMSAVSEPDIVVDYELPRQPDLIVDTDGQPLAVAVQEVLALIRSLQLRP